MKAIYFYILIQSIFSFGCSFINDNSTHGDITLKDDGSTHELNNFNFVYRSSDPRNYDSSSLQNCDEVTKLWIGGRSKILRLDDNFLSSFGNLKSISLVNQMVKEISLSKQYPELEELEINNNFPYFQNKSFSIINLLLRAFPNLKKLTLRNIPSLKWSYFELLQNKITHLTLENVGLTQLEVNENQTFHTMRPYYFKFLPNLTHLSVSNSNLTKIQDNLFAYTPNLVSLKIHENSNIRENGKNHVNMKLSKKSFYSNGKKLKIRYLSFFNSYLEDKGIPIISKLFNRRNDLSIENPAQVHLYYYYKLKTNNKKIILKQNGNQ